GAANIYAINSVINTAKIEDTARLHASITSKTAAIPKINCTVVTGSTNSTLRANVSLCTIKYKLGSKANIAKIQSNTLGNVSCCERFRGKAKKAIGSNNIT